MAGDISIGPKIPKFGGVASSDVEETWLGSRRVCNATATWKLDNQTINNKNWWPSEPFRQQIVWKQSIFPLAFWHHWILEKGNPTALNNNPELAHNDAASQNTTAYKGTVELDTCFISYVELLEPTTI